MYEENFYSTTLRNLENLFAKHRPSLLKEYQLEKAPKHRINKPGLIRAGRRPPLGSKDLPGPIRREVFLLSSQLGLEPQELLHYNYNGKTREARDGHYFLMYLLLQKGFSVTEVSEVFRRSYRHVKMAAEHGAQLQLDQGTGRK